MRLESFHYTTYISFMFMFPFTFKYGVFPFRWTRN